VKLSDSLLDNDSISHSKLSRMSELHFILGQDVFPRLISDVAYKLNVIQNYIQRQSKTSD